MLVGLLRPRALGGDQQGFGHADRIAVRSDIQVARGQVDRTAAGELAALLDPDAGAGGLAEDGVAGPHRLVPFVGEAGHIFADPPEQLPEQLLLFGVEFRRLVDPGDRQESRRGDLAAPARCRPVGRVVPKRIVVAEREGEVGHPGRRRGLVVGPKLGRLRNAHLGARTLNFGIGDLAEGVFLRRGGAHRRSSPLSVQTARRRGPCQAGCCPFCPPPLRRLTYARLRET